MLSQIADWEPLPLGIVGLISDRHCENWYNQAIYRKLAASPVGERPARQLFSRPQKSPPPRDVRTELSNRTPLGGKPFQGSGYWFGLSDGLHAFFEVTAGLLKSLRRIAIAPACWNRKVAGYCKQTVTACRTLTARGGPDGISSKLVVSKASYQPDFSTSMKSQSASTT
ncbi:hypothetical protein KR51_00000430 [Rubidibacter lacunae KORDI 51-2]|uniref:Uncharacterized protein n=1 Tax=Rubidibacter lacunae KORDI 51-2 TaxID=582515 RepID=U5DQQ2_9CHRO|nr:hypothetical protein KR51_00000430 [Rubidibacter lacunae KORDI 51-2]